RWGASRVMSPPRHTIAPRVRVEKPTMVRSKVLLPTPFRPSTARLSPAGISSDTSSRTTASPYPARTFRRASSVSGMPGLAQIDLAHARIGGYLVRGALDQHAAADHHDDAAGEAKHDVHVVLDEEHRDVLGEVGNRGEERGTLAPGHPGGRL